MLSKLLKYDLKWIYKVLIVFYILSILFSTVGRIFASIQNSIVFNVLSQICFGIAISMMISSLINNLMRSWVRFIRNSYKDESYLTHTLPVEKKTIYLSKVLSAVITMFTTVIVSLISLLICYCTSENMEALKNTLEIAASSIGSNITMLIGIISVILFLEMLFLILMGYLGIILGHKSNGNKIVLSIVLSFALYSITQIISLVFLFIMALINPSIMNLFNTTQMIDMNIVQTMLYLSIAMYSVYVIIYYLLGRRHFEKGVDVD